jgi:hypothetical protein
LRFECGKGRLDRLRYVARIPPPPVKLAEYFA